MDPLIIEVSVPSAPSLTIDNPAYPDISLDVSGGPVVGPPGGTGQQGPQGTAGQGTSDQHIRSLARAEAEAILNTILDADPDNDPTSDLPDLTLWLNNALI